MTKTKIHDIMFKNADKSRLGQGRKEMAGRIALIEAFKDTQRQVHDNQELSRATLEMQAGTRLYLGGFAAIAPSEKSQEPVISVTEDTTFHSASAFARGDDKVAVLNFANAYTPGGGVREGARAQEECLCRSSNLYAALTLPYLMKNYYKWNSVNTGDMGTHAVIYSPGVTVFKSDEDIPVNLGEWFRVDVITCAAPYYDVNKKHPVTEERLQQVFHDRIRNILEVAAANDVDVLILGAFGCGAFNNPPQLVAETFRQLLVGKGYGRFFKRIVFAIKKNDEMNTNYQAFLSVFQR